MRRKTYPTREYLLECFTYDDGKLYWIERPLHHFKSESSHRVWNKRFAGKEAGYWFTRKRGDKSDTRCTIEINGMDCKRHILVWILHGNDPPTNEQHLDHKDLDTTNDRIDNLRIADTSKSMAHRRMFSNNTTGYRGVYKRKGYDRWRARIQVDKKFINLGDFDSPEKAYQAYLDAAKQYFGEFMVE